MYKDTFKTVTVMIFKISHLMSAPWDDFVDKRERKWVSSKEHAWWKERTSSITLSSGMHMHYRMSTLSSASIYYIHKQAYKIHSEWKYCTWILSRIRPAINKQLVWASMRIVVIETRNLGEKQAMHVFQNTC